MAASALTAKWKPLENALAAVLREIPGPNARFFGCYDGIPGLPRDAFQSDGLLTDGKSLLAIEVECTQNHPDTNVSKYWMLLDQCPNYERLEIVHIFTPAYTSYPWRMKLAGFIAERAAERKPLKYLLCDHRKAQDYEEILASVGQLLRVRAAALGLAADSATDSVAPTV